MKEGIYKMELSFGRMGELKGKFIATDQYVKELTSGGLEVYFGEVLGKHSEVYCKINESDIELVSDNEDVVKVFKENDLSSGYNPFEYTFLGTASDGSEDDMTVLEKIENIIKERQGV